MALAKFEVSDGVRFIGTETLYSAAKCHNEKREYQIQRAADSARLEWVSEIFLELV